MFDGKSLAGWKETEFSRGKGKVKVENGAIVLGTGEPLSGVTLTRAFPKSGYEIRYEAMKTDGHDFFASLTFPVGGSHATFVTGGWGGDITGMSSIDNWDASENETRSYFQFEPKRWYTFRVMVTDDRIRGWIDEDPAFDVQINGRTISLRPGEIEMQTPLGLAAYRSVGHIRKIEYRLLK
jgi:hypothetical protein